MESDIFQGNKTDSPYDESAILGNNIIYDIENSGISVDKAKCGNTYLYVFYVNQGDMLLLITAEKNAYLIDTNIYNNNSLSMINKIKSILSYHNMDDNKIKGLIITHKHADHIRGACDLIGGFLENSFLFDYFIINLKYLHPTLWFMSYF